MHSMRLFRDEEPSVLVAVVTRMKPLLHMPLDIVAEESSVGKELFFLVKGTVDVIVEIPPKVFLAIEDSVQLDSAETDATVAAVAAADDNLDDDGSNFMSAEVPSMPIHTHLSETFKNAAKGISVPDSEGGSEHSDSAMPRNMVYIRNRMSSMKDLANA